MRLTLIVAITWVDQSVSFTFRVDRIGRKLVTARLGLYGGGNSNVRLDEQVIDIGERSITPLPDVGYMGRRVSSPLKLHC